MSLDVLIYYFVILHINVWESHWLMKRVNGFILTAASVYMARVTSKKLRCDVMKTHIFVGIVSFASTSLLLSIILIGINFPFIHFKLTILWRHLLNGVKKKSNSTRNKQSINYPQDAILKWRFIWDLHYDKNIISAP